MSKTILFGEPMALLIAAAEGPLEEVTHFERALSGAEVNVSIGLSRLGHDVEYLTRLGDDPFGHYIEKTLRENQIGTEMITYDPIYRTGIKLKNRVTDGSDPYAPYYRKGSAASHISEEEIDSIDLSDVELVHITGIPPALSETARKASFRLMERAKEKGITITFDPNLRPALWENEEIMRNVINRMAEYADIILPGIEECRILVGTDDKKKAAEFYQACGIKTVIIKDGAKGAFVKEKDKAYMVPGFKVKKVVDTVGAGDGFAVGVISGILEGINIEDSVRRGNAIGAMQIMDVSDNEGLPTRKQLEEFMRAEND